MAQIRLGLGSVNITDYLIVIARKTTTPLVIEAQEEYPGPQPTIRNVVVPASGDIDPAIYYVDIHESSDGSTLGLLLIQIVYDLKNNIILSEKRYYRADGGGPNDPASGQNIIADSYLDGKTISAVYKEGFRPLVPPEYASFKEYDLHTGGGIELLNGMVFGPGEITVIEISYATAAPSTTGTTGGLYSSVVTLTADTTLTTTHRGKRLKCASSASSRMVVTLEDVTTVPDGTFYYFTFNGGNQLQTKMVPVSGQTIEYNGAAYTEMTLGLGEYLRIERAGAGWEGTLVHEGVLRVGEKLTAGYLSHPNTMPEDGRLLDGDDYPRIWYWIKNILPSSSKIVDDTVTGSYTHPDGKQGLFVLHSTLKKFRMPNTQGISEKGLADFDSYGSDTGRIYDYPGGVQAQQTPNHKHFTVAIEQLNSFLDPNSTQQIAYQRNDNGDFKYKLGPSSNAATVGLSSNPIDGGAENRVRNAGFIYLRRI